MKNHFLTISSNFIAVFLLISLIATPIYFAHNFAKVAGVKSESRYLVISQIDKFPNLTLSQNANKYTITFTKFAKSQAFLEVLIVNNPTSQTQTYKLESNGPNKPFFGQDINDQKTQINVPAQASVPISFISPKESSQESQFLEFNIQ